MSEWVEDLSFLKEEEAEHFYVPVEGFARESAAGLTEEVIHRIADFNRDPEWLRELRLAAFEGFRQMPMPSKWSPPELEELDLDSLRYFLEPQDRTVNDWAAVRAPVRETFDRLGVVEDSRTLLGGVKAQFDSSVAFSGLQAELRRQGVVFVDSVTGLREYPELFREWFGSLVPPETNKFSALNAAVFTGGAFVYVPPGVKVGLPLKSYFRMNSAACGQFGRTLIVVDEGAELVFMEGCSAANHAASSLHASVGEIVVKPGASLQYVTFQNWSKQIFNLVQMRAIAFEEAKVKWLDCNIGGQLTMKYPATILAGKGARSEMVSIAFAATGQRQDTGGKLHHRASDTTSVISSKSISLGSGKACYRGIVEISPEARQCRNNTECDALLVHSNSAAATYPAIAVHGDTQSTQHEASVSKIGEDQIFYMRQRGIPESQAVSLSINGFVNDLVREFPLEYSAPLRQLIDLEMDGSVG